jgi:hypothetical protein
MEVKSNEKKVCENCHFITRPFGMNLKDKFHCQKLLKFVWPIQEHSCEYWKEWQPDDAIM